MRELRREAMVDTTEILLFDILQELKKLNERFDKPIVKEETDNSSENKLCPKCGKDHRLPGVAGVCARKVKKESGK